MRRRGFIRLCAATSVATAGCRASGPASSSAALPPIDETQTIGLSTDSGAIEPLQSVHIEVDGPAIVEVIDGEGVTYFRQRVAQQVDVVVGGALGTHVAVLLDEHQRLLDRASFRVDAQTAIVDGRGRFTAVLELAKWTLQQDYDRLGRHIRVGGKAYHHLVYWLRDHVFAADGARYFRDGLRTGIELYADTQRDDGMIWDNVERRPYGVKSEWERLFTPGGFIKVSDDGQWEFKRIPVTNDVEACFVEGLHATWQSTGDDAWMLELLPAATAALEYSIRDPYRWSTKYKLLKRGYSIDAWDFVSDWDAVATGHAMVIDPKRSELGVCFGDNLGYAHACTLLAQMLAAVGHPADAQQWEQRAAQIRERTDSLAWTGTHYRHHVPENDAVERDLGIDDATQVSLSNAYSLLRGIGFDRARAIIATYKRLHDALPAGVPGEWYSIHPPFPRGFDGHAMPGQYVNGGVLPVVGARLGHGALLYGEERYGVDVLLRLGEVAATVSDGIVVGAYRGVAAPSVKPRGEPLTLNTRGGVVYPPPKATANGQSFLSGTAVSEGVVGGVRFSINAGAVVLGRGKRELNTVRVKPRAKTFGALYLLHEADGTLAGVVTLRYADGSSATVTVDRSYYGNWWRPPTVQWPRHQPACQPVWRSDDQHTASVWLGAIDNPHPERTVRDIELQASVEGRSWRVLAISSTAGPATLDHGAVSYGIPMGWGAGSLARALIEGLAGIVDVAGGFRQVSLQPRWAAADEASATVTARYPDGRGYVTYRYTWDESARTMTVEVTGSGDEFAAQILLPPGFEPANAQVDGVQAQVTMTTVASSRYANLVAVGPGVHRLTLRAS